MTQLKKACESLELHMPFDERTLKKQYHKMALRVGNRKAFVERAKTDFKLDAAANIDKLKSIQTPTLLIWGAKDLWIPLANGIRMNEILVNSKLEVLENSGHVPMEENPIESLKLILRKSQQIPFRLLTSTTQLRCLKTLARI